MLKDLESSAPVKGKSVRIRKALILALWMLAIGVSMTGWLLALGYIGYLVIQRAVS